jgi:hypothetical protein
MESDCTSFAILRYWLLHLLDKPEGFLASQEMKTNFLLAWFAKSYDNGVENLSSKDYLTYHKAKVGILNLPSNYRSPFGASSKNSKPQHEANAVSSSNEQNDQKKKKGSSSCLIQAIRSVTGIVSTHQALHRVVYGYSVKSLKVREIAMVPKWRLPSSKLFTL